MRFLLVITYLIGFGRILILVLVLMAIAIAQHHAPSGVKLTRLVRSPARQLPNSPQAPHVGKVAGASDCPGAPVRNLPAFIYEASPFVFPCGISRPTTPRWTAHQLSRRSHPPYAIAHIAARLTGRGAVESRNTSYATTLTRSLKSGGSGAPVYDGRSKTAPAQPRPDDPHGSKLLRSAPCVINQIRFRNANGRATALAPLSEAICSETEKISPSRNCAAGAVRNRSPAVSVDVRISANLCEIARPRAAPHCGATWYAHCSCGAGCPRSMICAANRQSFLRWMESGSACALRLDTETRTIVIASKRECISNQSPGYRARQVMGTG